jgi:hypothetical protein
MHRRVAGINCSWWTSAAVKWKGEELHVNILTALIADNAITTWRRSATPKMRRGIPAMDI